VSRRKLGQLPVAAILVSAAVAMGVDPAAVWDTTIGEFITRGMRARRRRLAS
jgi:hypothetical protein